jgi:RNA polymerase sigma factor for flagellar operon FliA
MTQAESAYKTSATAADDRNELVMQELSQVYYIASRIRERLPQHVDLEDLVNAGVVGLIEASRSFDPAKSVLFSTVAKVRVRGAILDSLREADWGSRHLRKMGREIAEVTTRLEGRLARHPNEMEIAEEMNLKIDQLRKIVAQLDGLYLTGQQVVMSSNRGESLDVIEAAPSLDDLDAFDLCLQSEMKAHLAQAISKLSEREQLILSLYYQEELTMKEISEVVGVALSRVSQILQATTKKLKLMMAHLHERPTTNNGAARGHFGAV